jgi:hypothetical protein
VRVGNGAVALAGRRAARSLAVAGAIAIAGAPLAASAAVSAARSREPVLTGISGSHHKGYDQIVFKFAGGVPRHATARFGSLDASPGQYPTIIGGSTAIVTFSKATGTRNGAVAYGQAQQSFALPDVIQVVTATDAHGTLTLGVNLARRTQLSLHVRAGRDRIVLDVRTPGRIRTVHAAFVVAGAATTRLVSRPVLGRATPWGALERLFAGPTPAEQAAGLTFISSAAAVSRVSVSPSGVARVYLVGGCAASTSPVNLSTEIVATLKQFSSVRAVKIYGPDLSTEHPGGLADSIPTCLQPENAIPVPVTLGLLALAGLGVLIGLILAAACMAIGLLRKPDIITPSAYVAERIKAHPVPVGHFEPDMAWPAYPLRQLSADVTRVWTTLRGRWARLWRWPGGRVLWFVLPWSVPAAACLLVAGLTAAVVVTVFMLVTWLCAVVVLVPWTACVAVLRNADGLWHRAMRTEASCPRCYHVTPRPAYRCRNCDRLHRDIRPGRLGAVVRRCQCGALLPTMVLRAAWRLEALCQRCGASLRAGSAARRDVRVPIFGDTAAGKTRFMYAALDSLSAATGRAQMPLTFPDADSEREAGIALALIRSGQDTASTAVALPTALTCLIGRGAGSTLLHLFDAAGEQYRAPSTQEQLTFLDHGHGLVYILDPFSIGVVRDRAAGQSSAAIQAARAAAGDPELAYEQVVSRLRDSGVAADTQRLAVVVSKADLLALADIEAPAESAALADWLSEAGVHNLVLSARHAFAEVRYFSVASVAAASADASRDPGAPLRWLLAARGARVPGQHDGRGPTGNDAVGSDHHVRGATAEVK